MAKDKGNDRRKQEREAAAIPDESIEQAKHDILHGIGHGNPPQHTRFKKGQSGNPKGRPKSKGIRMRGRSANALILKAAARSVSVREGGEVKQVSMIEAAVQALFAVGLKGSPFALKHVLENYRQAECERQRQIEEENAIGKNYVEMQRAEIAEAERNGETPPNPLPHPDDVIIDDEQGVRFRGPVDEEGQKRLQRTCRMRDMFILQDALDRRESDEPEGQNRHDLARSAVLYATVLNMAVPLRFKLSEDEFIRRTMRWAGTPKRQLLKDVYRGWRALGVHVPRGKLSPPLRDGKAKLELLVDLAQRVTDGRLDFANGTLEELEDELEAMIKERQLAVR